MLMKLIINFLFLIVDNEIFRFKMYAMQRKHNH